MPSPRRARRSRLPVRIAAVTVVVGVLGIVGYGIWSALQVRTDLAEAETAVQHVKTAALSGDAEATRAASAELGAAVAAAHDQVSSPVWTLAGWLPWIGDDVAGARVAIDAGYQLSQRGLPALDTLVGLLPSLRPKDGKFDVKAVGALKEPVGELADVVADVRQQLAAQDSSGYVDALGSRYRDLQNQLASAGDALGSARAVVDVLPDLLGGDTSRHYLLAFCSNAEIRATGGFPGALALLEASDGRVKISRQATMADFGERDTPVLPLTAEEEKLFGEQLGVFFGDANFTPRLREGRATDAGPVARAVRRERGRGHRPRPDHARLPAGGHRTGHHRRPRTQRRHRSRLPAAPGLRRLHPRGAGRVLRGDGEAGLRQGARSGRLDRRAVCAPEGGRRESARHAVHRRCRPGRHRAVRARRAAATGVHLSRRRLLPQRRHRREDVVLPPLRRDGEGRLVRGRRPEAAGTGGRPQRGASGRGHQPAGVRHRRVVHRHPGRRATRRHRRAGPVRRGRSATWRSTAPARTKTSARSWGARQRRPSSNSSPDSRGR